MLSLQLRRILSRELEEGYKKSGPQAEPPCLA